MMTIYDYVRNNNVKNKGKLTQSQVDSINAILNCWKEYGDGDINKLAYIFATIKWETAHTFLPIEEYNWIGRVYAKLIKGHRYYGRGFVQLTWDYNYKKMGKLIGLDLLNNPDLTLNPNIAAEIAIIGMIKGSFTGKKLSDYFNPIKQDFIGARRIINGTDKASTIAKLALEIKPYLLSKD